jgi:hypothetical protein
VKEKEREKKHKKYPFGREQTRKNIVGKIYRGAPQGPCSAGNKHE